MQIDDETPSTPFTRLIEEAERVELAYGESSDRIFEVYGVTLSLPTENGAIKRILGKVTNPYQDIFEKGSPGRIGEFSGELIKRLIAGELQKYPTDFFIRNGCTEIAVYNDSRSNIAGFYHKGSRVVYLNAEGIFREDSVGVSGLFNHELLHKLERETKAGKLFSSEWNKRFPRRAGLLNVLLGASISLLPEKIRGDIRDRYEAANFKRLGGKNKYFSQYGSTQPLEDRAEFARGAMTKGIDRDKINYLLDNLGLLSGRGEIFKSLIDNYYLQAEGSEKDVVARKLSRVMSFLCTVSGGQMNGNYWADFYEGKVKGKYWRERY